MERRNAHRVAQTQIVKFIKLRRRIARRIHLVDSQHDGLLGLFQHGGHFFVGGGDAGADVGDQHDYAGVVDGDKSLLTHEFQNLIVGSGLDAAGIHHHEGLAAPFGLSVDAIPGDAGRVLHDGGALFSDAVE